MDTHLIDVHMPKNECNIGIRIKSRYNKVYEKNLYEEGDEHGNPIVYNTIYSDLLSPQLKNKQIVVTSMDSGVTSAVITALTQRYMYSVQEHGNTVFKSPLKIIYIDSCPDINLCKTRDFDGFNSSVVSNTMSHTTPTFTNHAMNIRTDQIVMFGLNEETTDDADIDQLMQLGIIHYTLGDLRKKGITDIFRNTIDGFNKSGDPVMVSVDLSAINYLDCPSVHRLSYTSEKGLGRSEYYEILKSLKHIQNLAGLCVTGYDFSLITNEKIKQECDMMTSSVIRDTITTLTSLKEKSINIFNEHSYFLIWRPIDDTDEDGNEDVGWYILRNCSLDFREQLISTRLYEKDTIVTDSIVDDNGDVIDVMITKTNMAEQEFKSYYAGGTFLDCILFPHEKVVMAMELLITPQSVEPVQSLQSVEPVQYTHDTTH